MKFSVPSKTLNSYASSVSKIINAKNALVILNNFLFTIEGETLTIAACDGDARRIVDLLRVMPEQELTFSVDESTMEIEMSHPNGSYKFMGINGSEYPRIRRNQESSAMEFSVPGANLLRALESTSFAAGTDPLRPQMMGVYWDIKPDSLIFVATDTHKLVKYEDTSIAPGIESSFILPNKSTNVFKSVFGKDEIVRISLDPEQGVTFETDTFTFDSRLVKGRFPDYNRVIPTNNPYTLDVDRQMFSNACRRVSLFVDEGHGLLKFKLEPDKMTIKASDNEYNTSGVETLDCEFNGSDMVIGFSSFYLADLTGILWTDHILFKLADPSRPAVIVPTEDRPDSKLTMLLMPMNVAEF